MYSRRAQKAKASEIRELLKLTEQKDMISFGGGLPAPEAFPKEKLYQVSHKVFTELATVSMQYGTTEGYYKLRCTIKDLMAKQSIEVDADEIIITTGSQQGLDLTAKVFLDEGDLIACENPTYLAAINAFEPFMPHFMEIDMDDDGLKVDVLEAQLEAGKRIKFLYTIPNYQNPSGRTLSLERRKRLLTLAEKYDFLIVEDNPYGEITYEGDQLPSIKSLDASQRVIYISTFSKIVCPGFRIGWVTANKEILNKYVLLKQGTDLHTSMLPQVMIDEYFRQYDYLEKVNENIQIYKNRRDVMLNGIRTHFPEGIRFSVPKGGMFIWVELPNHMNAGSLLEKAIEQGVAFVPGAAFHPNGGGENTLRLNFTNMDEEKISEGIEKLGKIISLNT